MQIYKYLNLTFSNTVEKSVLNMTSSGKTESALLSTRKGNSTEMLYKWRNTANMKFVLHVDRQWFSVYERLGYVPVYNQSVLRNMSVPLSCQNIGSRDIMKNARAKFACVIWNWFYPLNGNILWHDSWTRVPHKMQNFRVLLISR
jgi:hypothetical protein